MHTLFGEFGKTMVDSACENVHSIETSFILALLKGGGVREGLGVSQARNLVLKIKNML